MSSRPPLTTQEREQIRALIRFLMVVMVAIIVATAGIAVALTVLQPASDVPAVTVTP